MIKLDLHSHSTASPDGGISPDQYRQLLDDQIIDCIAITDHNRIDTALELQAQLGKSIIVGEEITTTAGEIIGLFLSENIAPQLTPLATVQAIKAQGGVVYIPHPFETVRQGLSEATLDEIAEFVDVIEVHNGRAVFQNRGPRAAAWAKLHAKLWAASSDAHGVKGVGSTYTILEAIPTKHTILELLDKARPVAGRPPLISLLYPKLNRFRKRMNP